MTPGEASATHMDLKRTAKDLLPPVVVSGLRAFRSTGRVRFTGPYPTWEVAAAASTGYDAREILEKVRAAALRVRRGEAAFERDSVAFDEPEHLFPHLAVFLRTALAHGGQLSVLDFGGSLGSTYYQCRGFLTGLGRLTWSVVEQPAFVECGKREFESDELHFYETVEECMGVQPPHVALLSNVLQYLRDPGDIARRIASGRPEAIIIDRTPVHERPTDSIVVQHVPPSLYRASLPFRIFTRAHLLGLFGDDYALAADLPTLEFETLERKLNAHYVGVLLERK